MPKFRDLKAIQYLLKTAFHRNEISKFKRPDIPSPPPYKTYPDARRITLPREWDLQDSQLTQLLQNRRSHRSYSRKPVTLEAMAYMLWASQGVTAAAGSHLFRTAPSAGALYPIETYIAVHNVKDLSPGIYHFDVANFELELLRSGDHTDDIVLAALNQQLLGKAAAVFIWSAVMQRNMSKYGDRGMRYIFMEAGHICQNLLLAAEACGSVCCPVGAFFDDELNQLLELDGEEETAIYLAAVGGKP